MDELDDFEFGAELPDDDDVGVGREEYDANNEATFGDDIVSDFSKPDLASYAAQTTAAGLEGNAHAGSRDEFGWGSTPGRSTDAPDASHLPMPSFGFDDSASAKKNPWDMGGNGLFSMWSSSPSEGLASAFGELPKTDNFGPVKPPAPPAAVDKSSHWDYLQREREEQLSASLFGAAPEPPIGSSLPFRAISPLRPADVKAAAAQQASSAPVPMSAADLEQTLIEEARRKREKEAAAAQRDAIPPALLAMFQSAATISEKARVPQQSSPPKPPAYHHVVSHPQQQPGQPPSAAGAPPAPPFMGQPNAPAWLSAVPQQLHRFVPYWLALVTNRTPALANMPIPPPMFIELMRTIGVLPPAPGAGPPGMPPQRNFPPMPPGYKGPMPPPPPNGMPGGMGPYGQNRGMPPHPQFVNPMGMPGDFSRGPTPYNDHWRSRPMSAMSGVRKPPGFPTGKTIEDFALEPYAGFMSKKEREWLIKIQLLQAMGTGQPFVDDYYYATWREKQLQNDESSNGNGDGDEKPRRDKKRRELVPRNYNAPSFSGSLGKPVSSTTTNPRHLIDVSNQPEHAGGAVIDDENGLKKPLPSQKKFRTLLLSIENANVLILQCEDKRRQPTATSEHEIAERMDRVLAGLFTPGQLPKLLIIPKGRQTLTQTLALAPWQHQARVVERMLECAHRTGAPTRVPAEQLAALEEDVMPAIAECLEGWTREQLADWIGGQPFDVALLQKDLGEANVVARDVLLCMLLACSRLKAHSTGPLFGFLRSSASSSLVDWTTFTPPIGAWAAACHVSGDALEGLAVWLQLLSHDTANVASAIARALRV